MPASSLSVTSIVGLALAASLLAVKVSAYARRIHSKDIVPFARERGKRSVQALHQCTHSVQVVGDVPGSLQSVWQAYMEEFKTGGGLLTVNLHDAGDKYGEGLVRSVYLPVVGGTVECIVDCVPYVRARYSLVAGLWLFGAALYVGETLFEPLGNGQVRVTWTSRFRPSFWGAQFYVYVTVRHVLRSVVDNITRKCTAAAAAAATPVGRPQLT